MRGLKVMLFGIAVILFSGFFVLGNAVGYVTESPFSWGLLFGLFLSFLGLVLDGNSDDGGDPAGSGTDDAESGTDGGGGANEEGGTDAEDGDDETFERDHYSASRFPPM